MASDPVELVILGGGTAGWMAAAGLISFLPPSRCRVRLIESEEIGSVGVGEATLPQMKEFNDHLGIDESEMMRFTHASFKLGIRFVDWGYSGADYIHPFGIHGPAGQGDYFFRRWLRAVKTGWRSDIQEFSFGAMAARAGRFDFPSGNPRSINSTFAYAYHLDASLYAAYLRRLAEARGVERIEGKVRNVHRHPDSGDVSGLVLESGEEIKGDFFIDCSGFRSLLLGQTLGAEWEDWADWLPCDRAWAVQSARSQEPAPYTRSTAMDAGWMWRIPLQHRTGNGYVFSSRFISEEEAARALLANTDGPAIGEPRLLKFQAGRRTKSWDRNVVALGLASGFLEPLESTSIYLVQIAIMHLIPLFPERGTDPVLEAEFNRRMDLEYERIRDFLILHYHLNSRDDAEIWRYCRDMEVPDSLTQKMALFSHSGHVEQHKDGLFTPPSWLAVNLGQGLMPEHSHPLTDAVPLDRLIAGMDELRSDIADRVEEMPRHATILARHCAGEPGCAQVRVEQ